MLFQLIALINIAYSANLSAVEYFAWLN